ncbi:MAG: hypothetical protein QOK11_604 [Pseudonocardiales bacterium]|nr:hypothetical protein [Pseudonocardiales bacterium]
MANVAGKIGLKLVTIAVSIPVGIATKRVIERAWTTARPADPPRKPSDPDVRWTDAVAWAAISAVGVVAADLIARRGAESLWRTLTGSEPPTPKSKDQTKLEAATA